MNWSAQSYSGAARPVKEKVFYRTLELSGLQELSSSWGQYQQGLLY